MKLIIEDEDGSITSYEPIQSVDEAIEMLTEEEPEEDCRCNHVQNKIAATAKLMAASNASITRAG